MRSILAECFLHRLFDRYVAIGALRMLLQNHGLQSARV